MKSALSFVFALLLVGCASPQPIRQDATQSVVIDMTQKVPDVAVSEPRNAAAGFALTVDTSVGIICKTIGQLYPILAPDAERARAHWKATNGKYVHAADEYMDIVTAKLAHAEDQRSAKIFYINTTGNFIREAKLSARQVLGQQQRPTKDHCEKLVYEISNGLFALSDNSEHFPTLTAIYSDIDGWREQRRLDPLLKDRGRLVEIR